ncbi:MAG: hypothetical protein HRT35_32635 [Algicola sp.]|nr:hypothetical protein [Algicola sp.]
MSFYTPVIRSIGLFVAGVVITNAANGAESPPDTATSDKPIAVKTVMPGTRSKVGLSTLKTRPWYEKINTFASLGTEKRSLSIQRRSTVATGVKETFSGDYDATMVSLTSGGNLFKNTSLYLDLTLTELKLSGSQQAVEQEFVKFQRNKTLLEVFAERQLARGWSLGVDLYYGGDFYQKAGAADKSYDEELGGGLSLTRHFNWQNTDVRLSYIFSHRKINLGDNDTDDSSKRFHNILTTVSHRWSYDWSADINLRGSYYPKVDEFKYWESDTIWSIGAQLNYRVDNNAEVSLNLDRLSYGADSSSSMIALNYRYQFGDDQSKRRKRRNKLPRLLIK